MGYLPLFYLLAPYMYPAGQLIQRNLVFTHFLIDHQDTFMAIILMPGAASKPVSDLFEFRRPKQRQRGRRAASALLDFTDKQHDAM